MPRKPSRRAPKAPAPPRPDWLAEAVTHHQAGRLAEAMAGYERILAHDDRHADALHLLGVAHHQRGDHAAGAALVDRAIAAAPDRAPYLTNRALIHRAQGEPAGAEAAFQAALAANADFHAARLGLGGLLVAENRFPEAVAVLNEHVRRAPGHFAGWLELGNAYRGLGQFATAETALTQAAALAPTRPEPANDLGVLLQAQGRLDEAGTWLGRAIAAAPGYAAAHFNLGLVHRDAGRMAAAEASYREALRLQPDYPDALNNLGNMLRLADRLDEAIACLGRAVALAPTHATIQHNHAIALERAGRLAEAEVQAAGALASDPAYQDARYFLAMIVRQQGQAARAEAMLREAIARDPAHADAWVGLGHVLRERDDYDEAEVALARALALAPGHVEALGNQGLVAKARGRYGEAEGLLRQAVALDPTYLDGQLNLAMVQLQRGDFAHGWAAYEVRKRLRLKGQSLVPPVRFPAWQGEDLAGKRLLVVREQGLGDQLQFLRYGPALAALGATVEAVVGPELLAIARTAPGFGAIHDRLPDEPFDYWVLAMSLPLRLGHHGEAKIPYLAADPERVARWGARLDALAPPGPRRIGLVWAGNPGHASDRHRSMPAAALAPLADLPGITWIALQKGAAEDGAPFAVPLGAALADLADTAAVLAHLDLVITVDTAVAHLAGALGRPVWVLLATNPDWRWLLDRPDTAWYPTARLVRQETSGDWAGVIHEVKQKLQQVASPSGEATKLPASQSTAPPRVASPSGEAVHGPVEGPGRWGDKPADPQARLATALLHLQAGRLPEAEAGLSALLNDHLVAIPAHHGMAHIMLATNRPAEAETHLRAVVAARPGDAHATVGLGTAVVRQGRAAEAKTILTQALALDRGHPAAHFQLGIAEKALGHLPEAAAWYARALAYQPTDNQAWNNLGNLWLALGRYADAEACLRRAVALVPDHAEAHHNLGLALAEASGDERPAGDDRTAAALIAEGEACLARAMALDPAYVRARTNMGIQHLLAGRYAEGWAGFAHRVGLEVPRPALPFPAWRGEDLAGKRLLVVREQGLGDQLQFIRFAAMLAAAGATVDVVASPPVAALLATAPGVNQVLADYDGAAYDHWAMFMDLPGPLGITLETLPAAVPYMTPDPDRVAAWASRLAAIARPGVRRVGLVWAGAPGHQNDRHRSMPLAALAPLLALPDVAFFALQKGPAEAQLAGAGTAIHALGPDLADMGDTAAAIANLDLVIAVDTSVVHLAGALGRPVWVLLSTNSDWRWLRDRADSPWYPTARLFRQRRLGDWDPVVAAVATALEGMLG